MISRVILSLSQESPDGIVTPTAISMFKISSKSHEWDRKKDIRLTLKALPLSRIGMNFIAIVTTRVMETILEISRDIGLVNTFTQWLYVVSDTSFGKNNVSSIAPMIDEGHNVAFMFNNTRSESSCMVKFYFLKYFLTLISTPLSITFQIEWIALPLRRVVTRICDWFIKNDKGRTSCLWTDFGRRMGSHSSNKV